MHKMLVQNIVLWAHVSDWIISSSLNAVVKYYSWLIFYSSLHIEICLFPLMDSVEVCLKCLISCMWCKLWQVNSVICFRMNTSLLAEKSVVPHTWGPHKTPTGESCLVAFFSDGQQVQRAKAFINSLKIENVKILSFYFMLFCVLAVPLITDLLV